MGRFGVHGGVGKRKAFQRVMLVSLVSVILWSVIAPTAYAVVTDAQNRTAEKAPGQQYPGAMPVAQPEHAAAADFRAKKTQLPGTVATNTPVLGDRLQSDTGARPSLKPQTGELVEKRTATTATYRNENGSLTTRQYYEPRFYQKAGAWETINTKLVEDKNAGDAGTVFGQLFGTVQSLFTDTTTYTVEENDWQARFGPSTFDEGMVRIQKGDSQIGFRPVNARQVTPVITTHEGKQVVHYYDLWPGVDVEYVVFSSQVKENIILKHSKATNAVAFELVGASLRPTDDKKDAAFAIEGALGDAFGITPPNLILNNFGPETNHSVFRQTYQDGTLNISVDDDYLAKLPDKAFPAVIDPTTVTRSNFGTRAGGNYISYKSDGYVCYSNECNLYGGFDHGPIRLLASVAR